VVARRQKVIVEVETLRPRPYADGSGRQTKKTFRTWVSVGSWPVIYVDKKYVIVKQFDCLGIYHSDGSMDSAGYSKTHPAVVAGRLPENHGWWRLNPTSLGKLRATP
jgi:hypothetical protein